MYPATENALGKALTALAAWFERQAVEKPVSADEGYYDEEQEHYVSLQRTWEEVRRLQGEVASWREKLCRHDEAATKRDKAHREALDVLLSNYRTLAAEVDTLKQSEPKCRHCVHED